MNEEELKPCSVCGGKGFLDDIEPIDYIDNNGNAQIRFEKRKLSCPNPSCSGKISQSK